MKYAQLSLFFLSWFSVSVCTNQQQKKFAPTHPLSKDTQCLLGKKNKTKEKKKGSTFFCTLLCVSFWNKLINLGLIKDYNLIVIQQQAFFLKAGQMGDDAGLFLQNAFEKATHNACHVYVSSKQMKIT